MSLCSLLCVLDVKFGQLKMFLNVSMVTSRPMLFPLWIKLLPFLNKPMVYLPILLTLQYFSY